MSAFYEMSEMTSSEFRDAARTIEIALVPVGATATRGSATKTLLFLPPAPDNGFGFAPPRW